MKRFRMGAQMQGILEALNSLENPKQVYQKARYGISQTEIILRVLDVKPYTETRKYGHDMWKKKKGEADALLKELEEKGKTVEITESGDHLIIEAYTGEYEAVPPQMRVASALLGKHAGQNAAPYDFMGRMQAVNLALKNPEMRNDPVVKRHFDWVEDYFEGLKRSNKTYASFSRSLKKLLDHGFIVSEHQLDHKSVRWFRTRYIITDKGRGYLSKS